MSVNGVFHLDRGNIFATADDDVLFAIAQLGIPIWMHHRQVAAMEPTAPESLSSRFGLAVIPTHDIVAAHDHLAQGLRIGRHILHGIVDHTHLFRNDVWHPLAGLFAGAFIR